MPEAGWAGGETWKHERQSCPSGLRGSGENTPTLSRAGRTGLCAGRRETGHLYPAALITTAWQFLIKCNPHLPYEVPWPGVCPREMKTSTHGDRGRQAQGSGLRAGTAWAHAQSMGPLSEKMCELSTAESLSAGEKENDRPPAPASPGWQLHPSRCNILCPRLTPVFPATALPSRLPLCCLGNSGIERRLLDIQLEMPTRPGNSG